MRLLSKRSFSYEEVVQICEEGVVRYLASAPDKKSSCGFELEGRWERRRSPSQRDGPFFRSPVNLWTNPSKSGICNSFVFELDSPIHSSCMNSAALYLNSSKRLALRHFTHWHLLYFYFELELAWTLQLGTWTLPRGLLSDTSHTGIRIILKFWFGIGWSQAALAWTLGTWTLPRGLLSDTSLPCMLFEIFHRSWSLHWSSFVCGGSPQLNLQGFTRHTPPALRYLASNPDKKAAADLSWKGGDREEAKIRLD